MIWLIIITVLFLTSISGLLFMPFFIEIDTDRGIYHFRFHRFMHMGLRWNGQQPVITFSFLFLKKQWKIFELSRPENIPGKRKRARKVPKISLRKIYRLLQSFTVRKFRLSIDTDDYVLNAQLFSVASFISARTGFPIGINFRGYNSLELVIHNNLFRMIKAMLT